MNHLSRPLTNCPNFREVGGYKTAEGSSLKQGVLFRSSHLADLSDAEQQHLTQLGITTVFDLRSDSERNEYPSRLPKQIVCHELALNMGNGRRFLAQLAKDTASATSARAMMVDAYGHYITQENAQFSYLLKVLSSETGGVLIHCMVGKDRTGIATALLLLALKVPRATIMADYLRSNDCYPAEEIRIIIDKHLRAAGASAVSKIGIDAMQTYCSARPEYLQAAFDAIDTQYGDSDNYLKKILGLTEGHLENLASRFLSPPSVL